MTSMYAITSLQGVELTKHLNPSQSVETWISRLVGIALATLIFTETVDYVKIGSLTADYMAYGGYLTGILFALVGAAYVAVATVDSGVSFTKGFFYQYHGVSALSCFMGVF